MSALAHCLIRCEHRTWLKPRAKCSYLRSHVYLSVAEMMMSDRRQAVQKSCISGNDESVLLVATCSLLCVGDNCTVRIDESHNK